MIDEHHEELASLYAFGLLTGDELSMFEAALAREPELKKLVDSLQSAGAGLALIAPSAEPSSALRARVMDTVAKAPKKVAPTVAAAPAKGKLVPFRIPVWTGWAFAAGFAVLAGYIGSELIKARSELSAQRNQFALSTLQIRSLEQRLEAENIVNSREIAELEKESDVAALKIAKLASLNGNSPAAVAIAVWNPLKQEGILRVENLPEINSDQSYQLWVVDSKHKQPVSGGVFNVGPHGTARFEFRPTEPAEAATHFAISRERKGGVPVREGPIVALGAL